MQTPQTDYGLNFPSDNPSNTYLDPSETHPSKDWFNSAVFSSCVLALPQNFTR